MGNEERHTTTFCLLVSQAENHLSGTCVHLPSSPILEFVCQAYDDRGVWAIELTKQFLTVYMVCIGDYSAMVNLATDSTTQRCRNHSY